MRLFQMIRFVFLSLLVLTVVEGVEKRCIGIFTCKIEGVGQWDPDSVATGIAGSEEAVIYMAKELSQLGYQVIVYGNPPKDSVHSGTHCNPRYLDADTKETIPLDIAISWRMPYLGPSLKTKAKTVYLWPHDTLHTRLPVEFIQSFNDILWLSEWQRNQWLAINPEVEFYPHIFGNGIEQEQFSPLLQRSNPHSCIYGSNYARGLEILLDLWPEIKQHFPNATLDIYYGWQHWGLLTSACELKMRKQIEEYAPLSVTDYGKVGHHALSEAYAKASIWAYPCICPETFCITALKAQASGAIPVIIEGSALTETVKGGFRCINTNDYLSMLLQALKHAETISIEERKQYKNFVTEKFTWQSIAKKWDQVFTKDLTYVTDEY